MSKFKINSEDLYQENIQKLKEIFPSAFEDGQINYSKLKEELTPTLSNTDIENENEPYGLFWVGKSKAIKEYNSYKNTDFSLVPNNNRSINFETTNNIIIEGDNLPSLALLKKAYKEKVKMIYIDPPYNTGNCFIYNDNYSETTEEYNKKAGLIDENGLANESNINKKQNGRFHSKWLSMMYPRLKLARELLRDDGVIFVSIDDNEQANLKLLMDEVFGEGNFVGDIIRQTKSTTNDCKTGCNLQHENCLIFAKNKNFCTLIGEEKFFEKYKNPDNDPRGSWVSDNPTARTGSYFEIKNHFTGKIDLPPKGRSWQFSKTTFENYLDIGKIKFKKEHKSNERGFVFKRYRDEIKSNFQLLNSLEFANKDFMNQVATKEQIKLLDEKVLDYPKPRIFIHKLISSITQPNDLILDFFAGSGTTGHAVMQLNLEDKKKAIEKGENPDLVGNRKYIMVQLPEKTDEKTDAYKAGYKTISDITIDRIRRAGNKILEENENINLDIGFKVFELKESNFKSINNEDDDNIEKQLELWVEGLIKEGSRNIDIVYELLLRKGFTLNHHIIHIDDYAFAEFGDENYHFITILYNEITENILDKIIKRIDTIISGNAPHINLLIRESGFENHDLQKINLQHTIKQIKIDSNTKIEIEYF